MPTNLFRITNKERERESFFYLLKLYTKKKKKKKERKETIYFFQVAKSISESILMYRDEFLSDRVLSIIGPMHL